MIDYETYCRIRLCHGERGLSFSQIGRELGLDPETVAKYARVEKFVPRQGGKRTSKLDAFIEGIDRTAILETVRTGASGIGRGERILRV